MKRTSITYPAHLHEAFTNYAEMTNRTLSEMATEGMQQMMNRYKVDKVNSIEKRLSELKAEVERLLSLSEKDSVPGEVPNGTVGEVKWIKP